MKGFGRWRRALVLVVLATVAAVAAASSAAAPSAHYTGTLADGGTWIADVPASWNGILLLYSHGFGPPLAADGPDAATKAALLDRGYALAGSSYDPAGSWWALQSAVRDQFETIGAVTAAALPHAPDRVLAVGTSMGGLISALEAQQGAGHIDGALSTCGLVAGAIQLNNYQLDGEYTIAKLLLPADQQPKLVNFASPADGAATGAVLTGAAQQAQTTAAGRARLALAFAFLNATPAAPGIPTPDLNDPAAVEAAQYTAEVVDFPLLGFIEFGRPWIDQSSGGSGSWTLGEDFAALLDHSPYHHVVSTLYKQAGLDLKADLATLTAGANIPADAAAVASLQQTSVPTGRLQVPELTLHTIHDPLVPVEHESYYGDLVRQAGSNSLLRQAYVDRWGHCAFTPAELVAGVEALRQRVETGRWDSVAEPQKLQASASALGLGDAAFVQYQPLPLSGNNGPFDPAVNG
jgi:alpha-beta hydrolase superfamily lysophospholipase